jgi:hypothetical protein
VGTKSLRRSIQNFKRFHGRTPRQLGGFSFTMPKSVTYLGNLYSIKYESTKKLGGTHRLRLYEHKTGPGVKIYLHPDGKSLIITGGKFRVTDWMRG